MNTGMWLSGIHLKQCTIKRSSHCIFTQSHMVEPVTSGYTVVTLHKCMQSVVNQTLLHCACRGVCGGAIIHVSVKIQSSSMYVSNSIRGWAFPRAAEVKPGPHWSCSSFMSEPIMHHTLQGGLPPLTQPFFCPRTESCLSNGSASSFHKWPACAVCDRSLGLFLTVSALCLEKKCCLEDEGNKFMSFWSKYMFSSSTSKEKCPGQTVKGRGRSCYS